MRKLDTRLLSAAFGVLLIVAVVAYVHFFRQ